MIQKANFNAGPALLPSKVEKNLRQATVDFNGTGLPVWSLSHRSREIEKMCDETVALVIELLNVPDSHSLLFCPGGATAQFKAWLLNVKGGHRSRVGFVDSGHWSSAAVKAARELEMYGFCSSRVLTSSRSDKYTSIPRLGSHGELNVDFVYFTSNETVNGTQVNLDNIPAQKVGCKLVSDMTSDMMSRPVDVSRFDLIFAGAQKNFGIAGTTLVIVSNDLIGSGHPTLPAPLVYAEQKKMNGALQNTADIFALCSVYYMLQWTKASGGVARMEKNSVKRASLLYSAIDESCAFEGIAFPKDRSLMNVIFRLRDPKLHNKFLEYCEAGEIVGLNGHRGLNKYHGPHLRASLYNGQTMENVHRLIEVMHSFEKSR